MAALAAQADIEARLGRDLTAAEEARVEALLTDASARVRGYTRQQFDAAETTQRLRPVGDKVRLPQRPVTAVSSVAVVDNGTLLPLHGWVWDGVGEIWLCPDGVVVNLAEVVLELLRYHTPLVEVTYTAGYDTVPDDVVAVVCGAVIRALGAPSGGAVLTETIGQYSYRLSDTGLAGTMGLTKDDRDVLNDYRRNSVTVELR